MLSCSKGDEGDRTSEAQGEAAPEIAPPTQDDPAAVLPRYDLDNPRLLNLPDQLVEISGLAFVQDRGLFGHNDEQGVVFRIDPENGTILERFTLGSVGVEDDFEGIEIVEDRFFLVNSKGTLYEFRAGADGAHVEFTTIRTGLSAKYDVEGLCYDPATNALLLACKEYPGKDFNARDQKTVYGFSLNEMKLEEKPRFIISAQEIRKGLNLKDFKPSGIERHPGTGSFFILSSNEPAVIELSPAGALLAMRKLPGVHAQPEGIAIDQSGRLFIANEGGKLMSIQNSREAVSKR